MNEYIISLSLSYFKNYGNEYSISDLIGLLGFTQNQMHKLISFLKSNGYIEYTNYSINITNKGLQYLVAKNQLESSLEDFEYKFNNIDKNLAISIDTPYVPLKFMKKL